MARKTARMERRLLKINRYHCWIRPVVQGYIFFRQAVCNDLSNARIRSLSFSIRWLEIKLTEKLNIDEYVHIMLVFSGAKLLIRINIV